MTIGFEYVNDYPLIGFEIRLEFDTEPPFRFEIRFKRKFPIRKKYREHNYLRGIVQLRDAHLHGVSGGVRHEAPRVAADRSPGPGRTQLSRRRPVPGQGGRPGLRPRRLRRRLLSGADDRRQHRHAARPLDALGSGPAGK